MSASSSSSSSLPLSSISIPSKHLQSLDMWGHICTFLEGFEILTIVKHLCYYINHNIISNPEHWSRIWKHTNLFVYLDISDRQRFVMRFRRYLLEYNMSTLLNDESPQSGLIMKVMTPSYLKELTFLNHVGHLTVCFQQCKIHKDVKSLYDKLPTYFPFFNFISSITIRQCCLLPCCNDSDVAVMKHFFAQTRRIPESEYESMALPSFQKATQLSIHLQMVQSSMMLYNNNNNNNFLRDIQQNAVVPVNRPFDISNMMNTSPLLNALEFYLWRDELQNSVKSSVHFTSENYLQWIKDKIPMACYSKLISLKFKYDSNVLKVSRLPMRPLAPIYLSKSITPCMNTFTHLSRLHIQGITVLEQVDGISLFKQFHALPALQCLHLTQCHIPIKQVFSPTEEEKKSISTPPRFLNVTEFDSTSVNLLEQILCDWINPSLSGSSENVYQSYPEEVLFKGVHGTIPQTGEFVWQIEMEELLVHTDRTSPTSTLKLQEMFLEESFIYQDDFTSSLEQQEISMYPSKETKEETDSSNDSDGSESDEDTYDRFHRGLPLPKKGVSKQKDQKNQFMDNDHYIYYVSYVSRDLKTHKPRFHFSRFIAQFLNSIKLKTYLSHIQTLQCLHMEWEYHTRIGCDLIHYIQFEKRVKVNKSPFTFMTLLTNVWSTLLASCSSVTSIELSGDMISLNFILSMIQSSKLRLGVTHLDLHVFSQGNTMRSSEYLVPNIAESYGYDEGLNEIKAYICNRTSNEPFNIRHDSSMKHLWFLNSSSPLDFPQLNTLGIRYQPYNLNQEVVYAEPFLRYCFLKMNLTTWLKNLRTTSTLLHTFRLHMIYVHLPNYLIRYKHSPKSENFENSEHDFKKFEPIPSICKQRPLIEIGDKKDMIDTSSTPFDWLYGLPPSIQKLSIYDQCGDILPFSNPDYFSHIYNDSECLKGHNYAYEKWVMKNGLYPALSSSLIRDVPNCRSYDIHTMSIHTFPEYHLLYPNFQWIVTEYLDTIKQSLQLKKLGVDTPTLHSMVNNGTLYPAQFIHIVRTYFIHLQACRVSDSKPFFFHPVHWNHVRRYFSWFSEDQQKELRDLLRERKYKALLKNQTSNPIFIDKETGQQIESLDS